MSIKDFAADFDPKTSLALGECKVEDATQTQSKAQGACGFGVGCAGGGGQCGFGVRCAGG